MFFRRYIVTVSEAVALYALTLLLCLFYRNPFENFFSSSLVISALIGLELRFVDDFNDFYADTIDGKVLFSRRLLAIFLSLDVIGIAVTGICFARFYYLLPAITVLSLLFINDKHIKIFIVPITALIAFYYSCGLQVMMIPLVIGGLLISIMFAHMKKNKEMKLSDVGGKAYHLSKIRGCNIPPFIVIPYYELDKKDRVMAYINDFCRKNKKYAVRSSGIDEDSAENSFAGVNESYLNVSFKDIYEHVMLVKESGKSERATLYRKHNKAENSKGNISVIIQEMVNADFAGVINTVNPVTNDINETVISVCRGLGDKLVDGSVDGTVYYINGIKETVIGDDILSFKLKKKLLKLSETVARQTDRFQDIEFAVAKNKVYLLQTRDIATYKGFNPHKVKLIIDNSNIIESYYGITSPLTYSFARDIYAKVYSETLRVGKVRGKIMDSLQDSLSNMLYYYDGKIYYNLKSWYHVTSIFPMKKSTKYMESMMGVKTSVKENNRVKLNIFDAVKIGVIFIDKLRKIKSLSDYFVARFNEIAAPYYGHEINLPNYELKKLYESIEREIIPEFTTPIINDCAVMFYFGRLKEKAAKYENATDIANACVNNKGNVESAESSRIMEGIAEYVNKNEDLKKDFSELSEESLFKKYYLSENALSERLRGYVYKYGARVMNELKLETVTMIENPLLVVRVLKNTLASDKRNCCGSQTEIPKELVKLSQKTRWYVRNRERLRLRRTYIFSVVRNIFLAYGRNYVNEGKIDHAEDIFYLTKDEVLNEAEGMREIIAERKKQEEVYKTKPYYDRVVFFENGVLPVSDVSCGGELCGIPSGAGIVKARVCLLNNPSDKFILGNIILTKRTDPGWSTLFPQAAGLIVEHGSMLSHSFVVAREMGLPAVVNIPGVTNIVKDGDIVTLDGIKGAVTIEH